MVGNPAGHTGDVSKKVAEVNGMRRGLTGLARSPWRDDFGITCLRAGWLREVAGIWEIDTTGIPTPYWEHGFLAIGGFAAEAELMWNAMQDSGLTALNIIQRIFKEISEWKRSFGASIDIWRIALGEKPPATVLQGRSGDHEETTAREALNQA